MKLAARGVGALTAKVLLLLLAAGYVVLDTSLGTRLLLRAAEAAGLKAQVQAVSGGVLGPLVLQGVSVQLGGERFSARRIELHWRPTALLRRTVQVSLLRVEDLQVQQLASRSSSPPTLAALPPRLPGGFGAEIDALRIDRLRVVRPAAAALQLEDVALCARWNDDTLRLCPSAATVPRGRLRVQGVARLYEDHLELQRLQASLGDITATARGRIGYDAAASALQIQLRGLRWPLAGDPPHLLDHGTVRLSLSGGMQRYRYRLTAECRLRGHRSRLQASGAGDLHGLRFDSLALELGNGRIDGRGTLRWSPRLAGSARLRFADLDPALADARFPGDLSGRFAAGTDADGALRFELTLERSRLRGYPLSAELAGRWQRPALQIQRLTLRSGATRLQASGRATAPYDLHFALRSEDLASVYPGAGGGFSARGALSGTPADPHLVLTASGEGLRLRGYRIGRLAMDADLDPARASSLRLELQGAQVGVAIPRARLDVRGKLAYQRIAVVADTARGDLQLTAAGGFDRRRREWGGSLTSAQVTPRGLGTLRLEQPAGILIGARRKSLEPACLRGEDGRLCAQLQENVPRPGWWIAVSLDRLRLAALAPLLPPGWSLTGEAEGAAHVRWLHGDLQHFDARLQSSGARLKLPSAPVLALEHGMLDAQQGRDGRLAARLALAFDHGQVQAQAQAAPGAMFAARALTGELSLRVPQIDFLQPLLPQVSALTGRIDGRLSLAGTLGAPRLAGRIALENGSASLIAPGIRVHDVQLSLTGDETNAWRVTGSARSGGGRLQLDGGVQPTPGMLYGELKVTGENFQAVDTSQARIWIDPDLQLEYFPGFFKLTGTLTVPKADITPSGLTDNGIAPSSDQVLVGGPVKPPPTPMTTVTVVDLKLGDDVRFDGFGLRARLGGGVKLIDYSKLPQALAQGELTLRDGRYKAYGQDLQIDRGRLIFSGGPVLLPAIDVLASRKPASDVTVYVRVRGTLAQPQLTLSSDPPMPREQQLAWLVLGHPLDQSSGSDQQAIAGAALGLGLAGGDFLASRVGKTLGLDTVAVGADTGGGSQVAASQSMIDRITGNQSQPQAGAAALTLGKYLTPRLFVSYGVSLLQPGNVFRLLYDLGHGFKLQAESGVASGGDLVYTVQSK